MAGRPNIVFVWESFGPYHIDRCDAVSEELGNQHPVIGIELAARSASHLWDRPPPPTSFRLITLFEDTLSSCSWSRIFVRLVRALGQARPAICFVCHYERNEMFLASLLLRIFGIPVIAMLDSKFDDKPRHLTRELLKSIFLLPYAGVMVSGGRARGYMEFFGFRTDALAEGYDTVSMKRLGSLAGPQSSPDGLPFHDRKFAIVARLVEKKNLFMALDAYAKYRDLAGADCRELEVCGDGPLRPALEAEAGRRGLKEISFCGALQPDQIASKLARSLALILPSTEEQWGLVANEAIALGLPLLLSTNCGARDSLLRAGVNGFIYEPDNSDGLAYFMNELSCNEALWRRMCEASSALRPLADTGRFVEAVTVFLSRCNIMTKP